MSCFLHRLTLGAVACLGVFGLSLGCTAPAPPALPEVRSPVLQPACPAPVAAETLATGKRVYMRVCASCHQMDGRGIAGIFPPLEGHAPKLAQTEAGRAYLVRLVLWGLSGPISIGGQTYQNIMPPQAGLLRDDEVAGVLSYVLQAFDNCRAFTAMPRFAPEEVAQARQRTETGHGTYMLRQTTAFVALP